MSNPAQAAGEEAKRLHKLAFPEQYPQDATDGTTGDLGNTNADATATAPDDQPGTTDPATATDTATATDKTVDDGFKHKYDVLLGKYNAEVPRLHTQLRELTTENTSLKQQVSDLTAALAQVKTQATTTVQPEVDDDGKEVYHSPHVTDEIRNTDTYRYYVAEYGKTYAERHFETSALTAKSTIKPVQERVEQSDAATERQRLVSEFLGELDVAIPAWRTINEDPEFVAWLQNPAPGTGETYHQLLSEVYYSCDLPRTAEIFRLYETVTQTAAAQPAARQIPAHLAAPGKTGGGSQTVIENNAGNVLRFADMQKLYTDYNNGIYRGKEAEYQAKKREFVKAQAEGRLI